MSVAKDANLINILLDRTKGNILVTNTSIPCNNVIRQILQLSIIILFRSVGNRSDNPHHHSHHGNSREHNGNIISSCTIVLYY